MSLMRKEVSPRNHLKQLKHYSYNIMDRIGKGYSSLVYKGTNQLTNNCYLIASVAIKCIDMKQVKDAISKEMLQCQIQALKTLNHPNILQCYDVIEQISHCYIVTEYCNDGDLSAILKRKRKFNQVQANYILNDIVRGFVELASRNFLHRDLKLANILMNNGKAKLADFGFAKKMKYESIKEKYNVGSPLYMAPQALKDNLYSIKSDIWSLGIIAYELLHGQTPWQCRTQSQLIQKIASVPIKFRESLQLSRQTKLFIKKCLEVDGQKRMSLQQLKQWLDNPSTLCEERMTLPPTFLRKNNTDGNPLSQLTNRMQPRTQRASSTNPYNKQNKQTKNKQSYVLSKQILDFNNTLIINEINTFRLMYKIGEKLKRINANEQQLVKGINQEVLRRVNIVKKTIQGKQTHLSIQSPNLYLNPNTNPSIIKYQCVISDYYSKYTRQITIHLNSKSIDININEEIKKYIKKKNILKSNDQVILLYWMVELIKLPKVMKRTYLQQIIEPKTTLTKQYVEMKIKQIL